MKILSLRLTNFQGHVDSTVEFSGAFNCIIGATNSGKSSIVRALMFVALNRWESDYVNKAAKKCSVTVTFDNNVSICRTKGPKVNEVSLTVNDAAPKVYKDFGTTYPKEIEDWLGGVAYAVDDVLLNFADQDDILFLLKSPNSVRLKLFGQLMGTGAVDRVTDDLRSDYRRCQLTKTSAAKEISEKEAEISKLPDVYHLEETLSGKEAILLHVRNTMKEAEGLVSLYDTIVSYSEKEKVLKEREATAEFARIAKMEKIVEEHKVYEELATLGKKIKDWCLKRDELDKEISTLTGRIEKGTSILSALLHALSNCPTCGTALDESKRELISV